MSSLVARRQDLVPQHIRNLKPYVPGKTIDEVIESYGLKRVSKLASNENRLGCSKKAETEAEQALKTIHNYPDAGSLRLRDKLAERHGVQREQVITTGGSEGVIALICRAFIQPGEHAVTATATFVGFTVQARMQAADLEQVPVTDDYAFDLDAIAERVTDRTKVVYLANPNNPTGTGFDRQAFERFMERIPRQVLVVMDEAYHEFAANDMPDYPNSLEYDYENVITLRTFSKAHGLAGFRVGYAVAREDVIQTLLKTKLVFDPSAVAQAAARGALDDEAFVEKTCAYVAEGRERLYRLLAQHGIWYAESYANSVMAVFDSDRQAESFAEQMLQQGVIVRHVPGFGVPEGVRITIGVPEEMDHLAEALSWISLDG